MNINEQRRADIKIKNVPKIMRQQIFNVAEHEMKTVSAYVRDVLREKLSQYPESVKNPPADLD